MHRKQWAMFIYLFSLSSFKTNNQKYPFDTMLTLSPSIPPITGADPGILQGGGGGQGPQDFSASRLVSKKNSGGGSRNSSRGGGVRVHKKADP